MLPTSWSWVVPLVAGLCGSVGGPLEPTFNVPKPRPSALIGPVALALPPSGVDEPERDPKAEDKEELAERSAEALREAYIALARLKADGAIEAVDASRPRALLDRALRYYKRGVSAFDEAPSEALAYAQAARALAEAVEAARVAQALDRVDPDLPPPPGARVALHTRLHVEDEDERPGPPMPALRRDLRVQFDVQPELELNHKLLAGVNRENFEKLKAKIEAQRAEMEAKLRARRKELAERQTERKDRDIQVIYGLEGSENGLVVGQLQEALDTTRQQIEAIKVQAPEDGQSVFYLDAASDLIEAARRDATSGRVERAQELARAAGSLSQVPRVLSGVATLRLDDPKAFTIRAGHPDEFTFEQEYRVEFEADDETDGAPQVAKRSLIFQGKPMRVLIDPKKNQEPFQLGTLRLEGVERMVKDVLVDVEMPKRVEVILPDANFKPGARRLLFAPEAGRVLFAPNQDEAKDDRVEVKVEVKDEEKADEPVVGIGVSLGHEEGTYRVLDLIEGGPAAEDGRVQPGDELVGVELEGERIAFEDKPITEVVNLVRGPAGSKVRLVIKSQENGEQKVVVLERKPLDLEPEQRAQVRIYRAELGVSKTDEEDRDEVAVEEREIILKRLEPNALRLEAQKAIAGALEEIDAEALADQISESIEQALEELDREEIEEAIRDAIEDSRKQLREQLEEALEEVEIPEDARRLQIVPIPSFEGRFKAFQKKAEERAKQLREEAEDRAKELKEEAEERVRRLQREAKERAEELQEEAEERAEELSKELGETKLLEQIERLQKQLDTLRERFEEQRERLETNRPQIQAQLEEIEASAKRLRSRLRQDVERLQDSGVQWYRIRIFTDDDGNKRQEIVVESEEGEENETESAEESEPKSKKKPKENENKSDETN